MQPALVADHRARREPDGKTLVCRRVACRPPDRQRQTAVILAPEGIRIEHVPPARLVACEQGRRRVDAVDQDMGAGAPRRGR